MAFQNRIIEYGVKPADQFLAHPKNARIHPQFQREAMKAALDTVGFVAPVLEAKSGYLVDGHERIWAALQNGNADVPYVRLDIDEDEEAYVLATFDPLTGLAMYDAELLDGLLQEVNSDNPAIQQMLSELAEGNGLYYGDQDEPPGDPGAAIDRAEQLVEHYGVERGQLWLVGRHRVMCGSSYDSDHILKLLKDIQPDMLHTDPPYGISIVKPTNGYSAAAIGGAKAFGSTGETQRKGATAVAFRNSGKVGGGRGDEASHHARDVGRGNPANIIQSNLYPVIEGDDTPFDPTLFIDFAPIVIMWGANYYADKLPPKACWITWDKRENLTRNNFADCELAWTNMDSPARIFYHLWNGLHKGSQNGERRTHPTEKPVALFEEIGRMYADKGVWVDLFAGTGAQMVAAERSGATCCAMEYEPLYVATILDRLERMGITPRLSE